jgi:hypothetical protein
MIVLHSLVAWYPQKARAGYRIQIIVQADDGLDGIIRGYLARSLAEIKNVTITDVEPDYKIQCLAQTCTLEGDVPSCVLSIAILSNLNTLTAVSSYYASGKEVEAQTLCDWLSHYELGSQYQLITARDRLQQKCSEFIASFYGDELSDGFSNIIIDIMHSEIDERRHPKEGP